MADSNTMYEPMPGFRSVSPLKLAYRGVLIERPCANCDTVDIHFDGKCNSGPCAAVIRDIYSDITIKHPCGASRFGSRPELNHDRQYMHDWVPNTYYPDDFDLHANHEILGQALSGFRVFNQIIDKVREIGWPEHYTSDLFRDYQVLCRPGYLNSVPPKRFVWSVRNTGTDIIQAAYTIHLREKAQPGATRYFAIDTTSSGPLGDLTEVNPETARALLRLWAPLP